MDHSLGFARDGNVSELSQGPILLYDGECGVCSASVQWILAHERSHHLRFAPLQSELGERLRRASAITDDVDSLIWMEEDHGQITGRIWSDAVVAVLGYVGGPWKPLSWIKVLPQALRHGAYRLFAKHRMRFAPQACLLPSAEQKVRFLADSRPR